MKRTALRPVFCRMAFAEMPDALAGNVPGRESENERIPNYNIGIALHDMVFAHHVGHLIGART